MYVGSLKPTLEIGKHYKLELGLFESQFISTPLDSWDKEEKPMSWQKITVLFPAKAKHMAKNDNGVG